MHFLIVFRQHSLSNTEDEIGNLQQVHQQVQQELLDLVTTHQSTVKEMQEINNKLQVGKHLNIYNFGFKCY